MWRCWYLYQISRKASLQLFSLRIRRWRWYRLRTVRKELKSRAIEKETELEIQESFFLLSTPISSSRIGNKSSISQTSLLRKMIYLADHRLEKNSDEYTESILWLDIFCDRIISSAKRVHIYWITDLFVSAPNLRHSSACFRWKESRLVKKWSPSRSVSKLRIGTFRVVRRASYLLSWSILPLSIHLSVGHYLVKLIGQLTCNEISS